MAKMQTAFFTTFLTATFLSVTSAAPAGDVDATTSSVAVSRVTVAAGAHIEVSIPPNCKICDTFGLACVAACLAGGPLEPLCDICAGPSIGACLQCIASN
ncbi:hypothetical protein V8F20_004772 [Naviculisporaceae sp. PSN 640]